MFALLLRSGAAIMLYSGAGSPDDDFFASGSVCSRSAVHPCQPSGYRHTGTSQPASNPVAFPVARAGFPHARPRSPRAMVRRCLTTASTPRWRMVRRGAHPQALHTSPSIISWALRHPSPKRRANPGSPGLVTMSCEHQRCVLRTEPRSGCHSHTCLLGPNPGHCFLIQLSLSLSLSRARSLSRSLSRSFSLNLSLSLFSLRPPPCTPHKREISGRAHVIQG